MRFDYYQENLPNAEILNTLFYGEENNIYVPSPPYNCHDHKPCSLCENNYHEGEHNMDVCDVFAFGSQKNMSHYFNLYNEAENLVIKYNHLNNKDYLKNSKNFLGNYIVEKHHIDQDSFCFYPEKLLRFHLQNFRLIGSHSKGKIMRN